MKNTFFIFLFSISGLLLQAQGDSRNLPISIGYFSQMGWQPGAKIGTELMLKNWEKETENFTKQQSYFLSPQVGFYTWKGNHISYLINADLGYKRFKSHKKKYSAVSIGLGYLLQSQIIEWKVSLSDGSKEKVRESWGWFLPTVNYEFGKALNEHIGWYSKFSYGLKISAERENSALVFVELGINYHLQKKY